jgi:predicted MFS family arabinose efflux permease
MGRRPKLPLLRLIAVQVCIHACMAGTRLAAPLLALRLGYSAAAVGVLLALFSLAQVFLAIPSGRYADRHSLRRPVAISVVLTVIGAGLAVLWPVFPALCLAALLTGGATGSALIALQRHVGRMASTPTELKQVFSWLAIGPSISNFIGPFSAGLMIDYAGFRPAFALMAVLPLVSWLLVRNTPELPALARRPDAAGERSWELLAVPQLSRLLLVNWLLATCWDVHTFVLPVLGYERGFSASVIGSILGVFAVAATAVRLLVPLLAARLREPVVITVAMASTACLFAVYPLLSSPLAMGACSLLLGFALGSVQPMVLSALHQITPEQRHGEALGLRMMTINASSALMPVLFGTAGAAVGVAYVFWSVGAAVAAGARTAWRLRIGD